ncbi:MAG: hypothetical protein R3307_04765 [Anaerolineales bacterium]|nr:hypothetical protein [Anaerolineales bacterium]
MKSNNFLVGTALLCLALAVLASTMIWSDISSPVKIGMYALGFSTGVIAGVLISRKQTKSGV